MKPLVHVILVNWNGWRDTVACVDSLGEAGYPRMEVTVVDNGSGDDSVEEIRRRCPEATLLRSPSNLGFAGGNNLGIRRALEEGADYCWILNNDTVVEKGALAALVDRMEGDTRAGICGSTLLYHDRPDTVQALGGGTYRPLLGITRSLGEGEPAAAERDVRAVEARMDYVAGASMLVSRAFLEEVGLMSEEYFLYYEEIDWALRAGERFRLAWAPGSRVRHKEGAAIGGGSARPSARSRLSDYYQLRNRLRLTRRHYPALLPAVWLTLLAALLNRLGRGQWDRVPMILKIMFNLGTDPRPDSRPG